PASPLSTPPYPLSLHDALPISPDAVRQPLRVHEVAAQTRLQAFDALLPNQEPELERAEAAPERESPIAQIFDAAVSRRLQKAWIGRHHANQMFAVADKVERAVEHCSQPLVRIDDEGIGAFDAVPHR